VKPTTEQIIDWGRTALNETGDLVPTEWNIKLLEAICSAAYEAGCKEKREWQGLTEDDALQLLPVMPYEYEIDVEMILEFASAIEQALKEKNNAV
jgi:hypothetical protein